MAREGVEITAEILHVDGHVGRRLSAVDDYLGSGCASNPGDLPNRIQSPRHIRDMGERDDLRAGRDLILPLEKAPFGGGNPAEMGACFGGEHLPGDDIGVVFHLRDEDFIPWF